MSFTVSVTTLSMGLKTFEIRVTADTTVKQLKELIMQQDENCPPPDRQRLIYAKQELKNEHAALGSLNPPVNYGSKFSMASELQLEETTTVPDVIMTKVTHYHDVTADVAVRPDMTVDEVLNELRMGTRGDIWSSGKFHHQGTMLNGHQILCDLPGFTTAPVLQFSPVAHSNSGGGIMFTVTPRTTTLWMEIRFYEGNDYVSTLLEVEADRTVRGLKEDIAFAFLSRMGKDIPRTRQHLVYSGQVKEDTDLVSSYPLGSRGTSSSEPAIFQLYSRQNDGDHPLLPPNGNDDESQSSSQRSNYSMIYPLYFALLFLTTGIILLVLGAMDMNDASNAESGWCEAVYATKQSGIRCEKQSSSTYLPSVKYVKFSSAPSYVEPCTQCTFKEAIHAPAGPRNRNDGNSTCPANHELPIVSKKIHPDLCSRAKAGSDKYYILDGWLGEDMMWWSSKGPLDLPSHLFSAQSDPHEIGSNLTLSSSNCLLKSIVPFGSLPEPEKYGAVCVEVNNVLQQQTCKGANRDLRDFDYELTADETGRNRPLSEVCNNICEKQCDISYELDWKSASRGFCCSSSYSGNTCTCVTHKFHSDTEHMEGSVAIKKPPLVVVRTDKPHAATLFYKFSGQSVDGWNIKVSEDHSEESCAEECVLIENCVTFIYTDTGECNLWSHPPHEIDRDGEFSKSSPSSGNIKNLYTTQPFSRIIKNVEFPSDMSYGFSGDCHAVVFDVALRPFRCHLVERDTVMFGEAPDGESASFKSILFVALGSVFILIACGCIALAVLGRRG